LASAQANKAAAPKPMKSTLLFWSLFLTMSPIATSAQPKAAATRPHLADYDAELRGADGRVDTVAMVQRLKELGVTTYYWLIAHAATDWDDLKLFLPEAARAHIQVWAYLVPPSESAPKYSTLYPEPFRLDYPRWAEEIARLSLEHTNLTAWVIDDFYENHGLYSPAYVGDMQQRAKRVNPHLRFLPLMYYWEINRKFADDYRNVIDGVVAAYPPSAQEIERAWAIFNDVPIAEPCELAFPHYTPSHEGDFVMVSQSATTSGNLQTLSFLERDDFTGPTAGYHFKQLLVNDSVVWEEDLAGGTNGWRELNVDVSKQARSKSNVKIAFRLFDKKGVGNFGVRWQLKDLRAEGLQVSAALEAPAQWKVEQRGPFEAGFGEALQSRTPRFHIPLIVMTAAQPIEFKLRHGEPASPERISLWLRMCLEEMQKKKCEGVVTYCLDKTTNSLTFSPVQKLFREFRTSP
jgi:hypothetical protein